MSDRYAHVLSFCVSHPWAIDLEMLPIIAGILARHIAGVDSRAEIDAALVNRASLPQPKAGSVAIIPVYGVIAPRMNLFSEMSGGTTFEKLSRQLRAAMADETVKTIVLDINSPGGSVAGNPEFAAEVLAARHIKPILAQAQFTMGSAAYHLGAAATKVYAAPSARVGSIGVYGIHDDLSAALEKLGVKRRYLSAGEGKVDGNETGPLSPEAEARLQKAIDEAFAQFVGNVVHGRGKGMTPERVTKDWKAHVYGAEEALSLGMIDGIATLDQTITRVLTAGDAADQRAALTFGSIDDPPHEPGRATGADRAADLAWQHRIERELLDLDF